MTVVRVASELVFVFQVLGFILGRGDHQIATMSCIEISYNLVVSTSELLCLVVEGFGKSCRCGGFDSD